MDVQQRYKLVSLPMMSAALLDVTPAGFTYMQSITPTREEFKEELHAASHYYACMEED